MDLSQKIIAAILAGFFLVALIRVFSSPFRLALKLLLNTLLGFLALGAVRLTAGLTGIALGAEPVECPGDRRPGPAGICAATVGPVDLVALHIVFKRQGSSSPRASKYRSTRRQPMSPACKPPDGQGRRGGDGDGFVQACVHPQPDLRQFFRFIPDDVTGFRGRNSPHGLGVDAPHRVRAVHPHRMPIRFIVPIDILREPDDVTLVRFSRPKTWRSGPAHRPPPPAVRWGRCPGPPSPSRDSERSPQGFCHSSGAENPHKAGRAEDPAPPGVSAYRAFPEKFKIEREKSGR